MVKLLKSRLGILDHRTAKPLPKIKDPFYNTGEYEKWREIVVSRAGRRCEVVENGRRCDRAEPEYRMYADHIVEIQDGGAKLDLENGMCKCSSHHVKKTISERNKRLSQRFYRQ